LEKKLSDVSCKVYDTSIISLPVFQSTSQPVKEIQRIKYSFTLIYSQKSGIWYQQNVFAYDLTGCRASLSFFYPALICRKIFKIFTLSFSVKSPAGKKAFTELDGFDYQFIIFITNSGGHTTKMDVFVPMFK